MHSYSDDTVFFTLNSDAYEDENDPIVIATILAHEYGHHIQDLLGLARARDSFYGYDSGQISAGVVNHQEVFYELQADAFAGFALSRMNLQWTPQQLSVSVQSTHSVGDDVLSLSKSSDISHFRHGSGSERKMAMEYGFEIGHAHGSIRQIHFYDRADLKQKYNLASDSFLNELSAITRGQKFENVWTRADFEKAIRILQKKSNVADLRMSHMPPLPDDLWPEVLEELKKTESLFHQHEIMALLAHQPYWPSAIWNYLFEQWDSKKYSVTDICSAARSQDWPPEMWERIEQFLNAWVQKPRQYNHLGIDLFPKFQSQKHWPDSVLALAPLLLDYDRWEGNKIGTARGMARALAFHDGWTSAIWDKMLDLAVIEDDKNESYLVHVSAINSIARQSKWPARAYPVLTKLALRGLPKAKIAARKALATRLKAK